MSDCLFVHECDGFLQCFNINIVLAFLARCQILTNSNLQIQIQIQISKNSLHLPYLIE